MILEFLEEYYRQNTGENGKRKDLKVQVSHSKSLAFKERFVFSPVDKLYCTAGVDARSSPVGEASCEQRWMWYEPPVRTQTFDFFRSRLKNDRTVVKDVQFPAI